MTLVDAFNPTKVNWKNAKRVQVRLRRPNAQGVLSAYNSGAPVAFMSLTNDDSAVALGGVTIALGLLGTTGWYAGVFSLADLDAIRLAAPTLTTATTFFIMVTDAAGARVAIPCVLATARSPHLA